MGQGELYECYKRSRKLDFFSVCFLPADPADR